MDPVPTAVIASWTLDWETLCFLLAIAALYLRGWLRLHREIPHKYTTGKLKSFAGGLLALVLALQSPIDAFGSLLLQVHMIQHLSLIAVAAPLLLLGQPVLPLLRGLPRWIFKDALGPFLSCKELKQLGRAIVHPVVTWLALSASVAFWHLPRFYELALSTAGWHQVEHGCFFSSAVLLWWPVIGVWPSHPVWPKWAMVPYLLFANLVSMGLAALLSFSGQVLYASYQLGPRLWGISALDDQSAAGAIMWVPGSIPFLIPAIVLGMQALDTRRAPSRPELQVLTPRPIRQWDLLRTPFLGPILRYRHFRRSIQVAMLLLPGIVMLDGFFGAQVAPVNLAGMLPWTYWRGLAVIGLLMAGNVFCMACPFPLPREFARKFVSPRFCWPHRLRSKWISVGLLVAYLWAYEAFAIWDSPAATAWIILGYFVAAFSVDTLFQGASFCKYVCPIGQFHFVHSLVSPLEVKVREAPVCGSCTTHDCIRGHERQRGCELQLFQPRKSGNMDCTFCLDCVHTCPHQNVSISRVAPGQHLLQEQHTSGIGRLSRRPDVTALALTLVFGAFVNSAGMTAPVMMWMHQWHARLGSMVLAVTMFYAVGLLIVPAMLTAACGWISSVASGLGARASGNHMVGSFTLALIPIGFSMWLAHFSNHLFAMPSWMPSLEILSLDLGLLLTLYTAWRVARRLASDDGKALAAMSSWAVLAGGLYATGIWIVFQPMQMRGMMH